MRIPVVLGLGAASVLSSISAADTAPIGPGDPTWAIRGVLGYTKTGGNTDNSAGNLLFHAAHVMGNWKLLFGTEALYGSTKGETTAQAWLAYLQANYNITPKLYWYVGARYDDDRFSGFAYQEAVKTGVGYKFIDTDSTKLAAQIGVLAGVTMQSGQDNTLTNANVALEVKMSDRLALTAGYKVIDNSHPPPGTGRRDTLTTLGVAYELKNEKLPPE